MICCKIVADYDNENIKFSKLYENLSKHGSVLWTNNCLFVGSMELDFNEQKIKKILKKFGVQQYFIFEYLETNQVKENEYINGWLLNFIINISVKKIKIENQKELKELSKKIDDLNSELEIALENSKNENN